MSRRFKSAVGRETVITPVVLIMGVLWRKDEDLQKARERVEGLFGLLDCQSRWVPFNYTSYYKKEMGEGIKRMFWSFSDPFPPGCLLEAKLATNRIEASFLVDSRRKVNLDPGLLDLNSLVLATTKPYSHRIYLGKGIFAESTLIFRKGAWEALPWTYPDYREEWVRDFFLFIREEMKKKLKRIKHDG